MSDFLVSSIASTSCGVSLTSEVDKSKKDLAITVGGENPVVVIEQGTKEQQTQDLSNKLIMAAKVAAVVGGAVVVYKMAPIVKEGLSNGAGSLIAWAKGNQSVQAVGSYVGRLATSLGAALGFQAAAQVDRYTGDVDSCFDEYVQPVGQFKLIENPSLFPSLTPGEDYRFLGDMGDELFQEKQTLGESASAIMKQSIATTMVAPVTGSFEDAFDLEAVVLD